AAILTDEQLLARFVASQDQVAFEELVRRHGPMVLRVCRRILHHAQDAEDAFQATFIVLMRKARTISRRELLANWLHGVAFRVALKAKNSAGQRHARATGSMDTVLEDNSQIQGTGDTTWRDLRPLLDEEVHLLPERYRAPIVLCYLEGKTNEETALL